MLGRRQSIKNYYRKGKFQKRRHPFKRFGLLLKLASGICLAAFMSLVFMLIHDLVTQSDYFRAKYLFVAGTQRLSADQLLRQADIRHGSNILAINLFVARNRLLNHPWIAEASVKREIPNGIRISIKEHTPVAVVDLGRKFLISAKGFIFKERESSDPENLPLISGLRYSDIKISSKNNPYGIGQNRLTKTPAGNQSGLRQSDGDLLNAVMEILRLGQKEDSILPNDRIKQIRVDKDIGLTLTLYPLDTIREIKLGVNDFSDKYAVLKKVLNYIKSGKLKHFADYDSIDLNNLNRVVLHPIKTEKAVKGHKEV